MTEAMKQLRQLQRELFAYNYAMALMMHDQSTVAPSDGDEGRNAALETLSGEVYKRIAGDVLPKLLEEAAKGELSEQEAAEVRELKRANEEFSKIPADEYAEAQVHFSQSQSIWPKAKTNSDFSLFAPYLEKSIAIRRKWAAYFDAEKNPYAVWLDHYQPGLTIEDCDAFFAALRKAIVPLLHRIQTEGTAPRTDFLRTVWPVEKQKELSAYLMNLMGLTSDHCVLAETEHPYTMGLYNGDVRITTHYYPTEITSNIYSTIHEGGHALYERGSDDRLNFTVLSGGNCTSLHESQSRLFENYVGRSREVLGHIWPKMLELFPEQLAGVTCEEFYRAVNTVEPGLIRTEADEMTYALHIMVRYELEKKMINGEIAVNELPAEWNRMYKEYLGVDVSDDAHGILQDIHWSMGDFGYFPGYALGTAYAAQMVQRMKQQFDFADCCAKGDLKPICDYQREHLWQYGQEKQAGELIAMNCGEVDPMVFVEYLEKKYSEIYQL